ncbi:MAG: VanZ family protein [Prolixibacteraceae bacterium]|nr:VanZ family protein [Prolixibacteraceae bacterium]
MQNNIKYFYLIIWISLSVYALLTPSDSLPKFKTFEHFDKIVHAGMFFTLFIILVPIFLKNQHYIRSYFFSFIATICTGIVFEILQNTLSGGRSGSVADAIANATGAVIGIFCYHYIIKQKPIEKFVFRIQ